MDLIQQLRKSRRLLLPTLSALLLLSLSSAPVCTLAAETAANDIVLEKTLAVISKMPGLTPQQLEESRSALGGMDYNSQRAVRKISQLPGVSFELSKTLWTELKRDPLSFEQLLAFEQWADLNGAAMPQTLKALEGIRSMSRDSVRTFRACIGMSGMTASLAQQMIPTLNSLDDASSLAVRNLFSVQGMDIRRGIDSLRILHRLRRKQAWAYALFAGTPGMTPEFAIEALGHFLRLRDEDAWNMQFFLKHKKPDPNTAWSWLVRYFAQPVNVQEGQYYSMNDLNRTALLDSFHRGGEEIVWTINNLHAVTNEYGIEYSQAELMGMSVGKLLELFDKLSEKTRVNYGGLMAAARSSGQKAKMVAALRQATTADRSQVAEDMTSANIYALLSLGSELYDSSFRDILVPILKKRIRIGHQDNLLVFLRATDPTNLLVSSFIVSLAQKGKLTTFFPEDAIEQQKILSLVATSAFKDEDSILLFSATFRYLLTVLEPSARHYLIQKMVAADSGSGSFSKLITVILQYYLQEYQDLLAPQSQELVRKTIARNGAVDLSRYLVTPFAQWKQDGRLASISVFHPDDDGRTSFVSNAQLLSKHGYRLVLSEQYSLTRSPGVQGIIDRVGSSQNFGALFDAMRGTPFSAAFVKKVNGLLIRHSVIVYKDQETQQQLIQRFLQGGDEMFAQRGHSYWRSEQIIDPIVKLQEGKQIAVNDLTSRQRFLSLGSCGGVKVYTKLNRMFMGHVDIMATIGTGMAMINDPYNLYFFEIVASNSSSMTWEDMARRTAFIFSGGRGQDYLQPGCLTAILHKILDEDLRRQGGGELPQITDPAW